jgi:hypothetical protein
MNGVWVDAANVVVGEFGAGLVLVVPVFFVVIGVVLLVDGVMWLPGCLERRAARKKEEYVSLMKQVLREFGTSHLQRD